jgi:SAM-dependent methyltransferase
MYLRQPAPDHTLAEVGRAAVRKSNLRADGAGNGMWQETSREGSLPPSYFHKIYERTLDPWDFEKSRYEAEKYDATLASLPRERYTCGFEVGCSIGVLTERLAGRCESLLSVDVSERALERARERCAGLPQVRFQRMKLPAEMPEARFDLIVVSEVAYYWTRSDVEAAIEGLAARHLQGGHLVLVHFTDPVPDYPLTGDQVHELWLASPHWKRVVERRAEHYRLDVLERV